MLSTVLFLHERCVEVSCPLLATILLANSLCSFTLSLLLLYLILVLPQGGGLFYR